MRPWKELSNGCMIVENNKLKALINTNRYASFEYDFLRKD